MFLSDIDIIGSIEVIGVKRKYDVVSGRSGSKPLNPEAVLTKVVYLKEAGSSGKLRDTRLLRKSVVESILQILEELRPLSKLLEIAREVEDIAKRRGLSIADIASVFELSKRDQLISNKNFAKRCVAQEKIT